MRYFKVLVTEAGLQRLRMLHDWQLTQQGFVPESVTEAVLSTDYQPGAADASDKLLNEPYSGGKTGALGGDGFPL